jgi:adenylate cyclase
MVGFNVAHWVRCLRPGLLIGLGRLDEADRWLSRLMQIEDDRIEPIIQFIPHFAAVELAWRRGRAAAAKWHSDEVTAYAQKSAVPFVFVAALLCQGLAECVAGDFVAAERHLLAALEAARRGKAGLEQEARLLALLTETYLRASDTERAVQTAAEAMETSRRRTDRYAECHAAIVGAMALAATGGASQRQQCIELLSQADALIARTGALVFCAMRDQAQLLVDTGSLSWS